MSATIPLAKTKALVGTSLAVTTAHAPLDGTARTATWVGGCLGIGVCVTFVG